MMFTIIEVQNEDTTRVYNLEGPRLETVRGFWDYLVATKTIESYTIEGGN
jgi:hypothetical protein